MLAKRLIVVIDNGKKAVGSLFLAKQHSVEFHPFSTCQRRCFHIFGTLHKRHVYLLQFAITATVLKRRQQNNIRLDINDFLDHRIHTAAAIGNPPLAHLLLNIGNLDILKVGNTHNTVGTSYRRQQ